jgi:hypothetical protein
MLNLIIIIIVVVFLVMNILYIYMSRQALMALLGAKSYKRIIVTFPISLFKS